MELFQKSTFRVLQSARPCLKEIKIIFLISYMYTSIIFWHCLVHTYRYEILNEYHQVIEKTLLWPPYLFVLFLNFNNKIKNHVYNWKICYSLFIYNTKYYWWINIFPHPWMGVCIRHKYHFMETYSLQQKISGFGSIFIILHF